MATLKEIKTELDELETQWTHGLRRDYTLQLVRLLAIVIRLVDYLVQKEKE